MNMDRLLGIAAAHGSVLAIGAIVVAALVTTALAMIAGYKLRRHDLRCGIAGLERAYPVRPVSPGAQEMRCSVVAIGMFPYVLSIRMHVDPGHLFLSQRTVAGLQLATTFKDTIAIPLEHVSCRRLLPFGMLRVLVIEDEHRRLHFRLVVDITAEDCRKLR